MKELRIIVIAVLVAGLLQPLSARVWAAFNPSPQAWTTTFESDPTNTDSISLADDHMRQMKIEVRDRMETEVDFGSGIGLVTTDTGRLLAGAARCFVQASAPSVTGSLAANCLNEADRNGNRGCDQGRCWVDTDGPDGVLGGAGAADDYTFNVTRDTDADGDADVWQTVKSDTAGGIGGTVPTGALIGWDQSSTCPAGYSEATEFRSVAVRGADIGVLDANVPNAAGVTCSPTSVPVGCGAPGGAVNYSDFIGIAEVEGHAHTLSAHTHGFSDVGHTHTIASHTHTLAHTHSVTGPPHSHDILLGNQAGGGGGIIEENGNATVQATGSTESGGGFTVTSGAASTSTTSSNVTGLVTGGGTVSGTTGGPSTANTSSAGGGQPNLGPFRTILWCRKT